MTSKYYLIAGTVFVFCYVLALLNSAGMGYKVAFDPLWRQKIQQNIDVVNAYANNPIMEALYTIGDWVSMFPAYIQAFFYATVLLPVLLANFFVPPAWNALITAAVEFSYLAAGIKFISGREM